MLLILLLKNAMQEFLKHTDLRVKPRKECGKLKKCVLIIAIITLTLLLVKLMLCRDWGGMNQGKN